MRHWSWNMELFILPPCLVARLHLCLHWFCFRETFDRCLSQYPCRRYCFVLVCLIRFLQNWPCYLSMDHETNSAISWWISVFASFRKWTFQTIAAHRSSRGITYYDVLWMWLMPSRTILPMWCWWHFSYYVVRGDGMVTGMNNAFCARTWINETSTSDITLWATCANSRGIYWCVDVYLFCRGSIALTSEESMRIVLKIFSMSETVLFSLGVCSLIT